MEFKGPFGCFFIHDEHEDEETRNKIAKEMASMPLTYMAPAEVLGRDEGGLVCKDCADKLVGMQIDAYNSLRGFDWRGQWLEKPPWEATNEDLTLDDFKDPESALQAIQDMNESSDIPEDDYQEQQGYERGQPFYVIYADGLTINQVVGYQQFLEMGMEIGIDEWEEDQYSGQSMVFGCGICEIACVSIDARPMIGDINKRKDFKNEQ